MDAASSACSVQPDIAPPPGLITQHSGSAAKEPGSTLGLLTLAIFLGAAIDLFGPAWAHTIWGAVKLDSPSDFGVLLAALAASIALHEAGHLAAALLMDFEVLGLCVGPLRATRSYHKWTVEFSGKLFSGSVSAV